MRRAKRKRRPRRKAASRRQAQPLKFTSQLLFGLTPPSPVIAARRRSDGRPAPFLEASDAFRYGTTVEAARRSLVVRRAFMDELIRDPRVVGRFQEWRSEFRDDAPSDTALLKLVRDDLQLRWGWCVVEIVSAYFRWLLHLPSSVTREAVITVLAPAIEFKTRPGESCVEVIERLDAVREGLLSVLRTAVGQPGRKRKRDEHLRRIVSWYYARNVAATNPSLRSLSFAAGCDRKTVREGIAEAGAYLGLGSGILREPSAGERTPLNHR